MRKKISIIGAGNVGSTTAHWMVSKGLGDVMLLDISEGVAKGKALDLRQAMPLHHMDAHIDGTSDYKDTKNSDIVVITAGLPRKPGMSRDDLLATNAKIMEDVCSKVKKYSPNAILIVVSNPLDAMVYKAWKVTGFPKERVMGMAGVLDSTRFRAFIAMETGFSVNDVHAMVLGGHGDTMVPLKRYANVAGIPLNKFMSQKKIDAIVERTQNGGAEIVKYLQRGSAFYAPGKAVTTMVSAILQDHKRILPCAALCKGEYGARNLFIGVPTVLGSKGVEKIIEVELDKDEKKLMDKTVAHVKALVKNMK